MLVVVVEKLKEGGWFWVRVEKEKTTREREGQGSGRVPATQAVRRSSSKGKVERKELKPFPFSRGKGKGRRKGLLTPCVKQRLSERGKTWEGERGGEKRGTESSRRRLRPDERWTCCGRTDTVFLRDGRG